MHIVAATQFVQVPIVLNSKTISPTLTISGWNISRKGIYQRENSTKFIRLRFTLTYRRRYEYLSYLSKKQVPRE